jgi:hypothetical protein
MLDYSDLTIIKNNEGIPTALGYTINSLLLQNNKPLFVGGGKNKYNKNDEESSVIDYDQMLVPAGLVCMTETICARPYREKAYIENDMEYETIPDGLYEKLMALAETKSSKKTTRNNNNNNKAKTKKNKTHRKK